MHLLRKFPAATWLRAYDRGSLTSDLLAAAIVTLMLIPQSLAYALLAGLPPEVGLYASILPLVGYALFGSSRTLAVGPVAVVSLMTASAAGGIAAQGSPEYTSVALILAGLSGLFLVGLGLLRLGSLASLLSHPVISGFITASALVIAASQLGPVLGLRAGGDNLVEVVEKLASNVANVHLPTLAVGGLAIALLLWIRHRLGPLLKRRGVRPAVADLVVRAGPVVAVVASIAAVALFGLDAQGVATVGAVPGGLPPLTLPDFDPELWLQLLPAAVLISIVGFVESVSVAQSLAVKRRQRIDPNQELLGLGAANLAASFTGGYPVTGGFARSIVNYEAGAQTPAAGVFTAVLIAVATLLLTPLFRLLPSAVLAATIIVAVIGLVDLHTLVRTWRYDRADFVASAATVVLVLGHSIEAGLVAGVGISIALFLWRTTRPHVAIVGRVPGTEHYRNVRRHEVLTSPRVLAVRIDESLYFANSRYLEDCLTAAITDHPDISDVVLIASAVNAIDASALESLELLVRRLADADVTLHFAEVKGPVMDRLARVGFTEHLGRGRVFRSTHEAMVALDPAMAG